MLQLIHISGTKDEFQMRVNEILKNFEAHPSDTVERINYSSCMFTSSTGVEVLFSAFIEVDIDDSEEEDDDEEENCNYTNLLNRCVNYGK